MSEQPDYRVTLRRDPLFGLWNYEIQTPDGRTLRPLFGASAGREGAEKQALRRIEIDRSTETLTGTELAARVQQSAAASVSDDLPDAPSTADDHRTDRTDEKPEGGTPNA